MPSDAHADLNALRARLDETDRRIIDALATRESVIADIARAKLDGASGLRDVRREEELLARLVEVGKQHNLDRQYVTRLFREILDHSLRRQQETLIAQQNPGRSEQRRLLVGYQGTEGAYSHTAGMKHFSARDAEAEFQGFDSFAAMLEAVREGACDYAMQPIENTTAGSINDAYDLLARMNLSLVGEEIMKIDHCLLALEDVPLSRIHRIYSHPQALVQCSEFLDSLKHCHIEAFTDTAMAAKKMRADQDLSQAAIASEEAARIYDLKIIKRSIANQKENYTRFVVVSRDPVKYDLRIPCKTSLIFATRHEEGALLQCMRVLHDHRINMTKLESRPRPNTPWEYLFYVDFEGNVADPNVSAALQDLAATTSLLKVLGSYPSRTTKDARPAEPRAPAPVPAQPRKPKQRETPEDVLKMLAKQPYKLASRITRAQDTTITIGGAVFGGDKPVIVAGPCSVESREQIFACAQAVKESGGHMLRGGCFKPRTSPYAFQGMGYDGLDIMADAGEAFGLPIVTEVMHPADVERVARKAHMIQLGARNMQNFSLLKEVGQVDRPVMLKRGLMASIDEWLAAAEYILAAGNQQVVLCERGIRTFETATRNTLDLSAVPVARERTHLPVIVDPSHACGTYRWIPRMALASLAAGAHGIMIETHPEPAKALSDGPQALTFDMLAELMGQLRAHAYL